MAFSPQTFSFLDELSANNRRDWFQSNRSRYEIEVRQPAFSFIEAMQKPLASISPRFRALAKPVGGSLMRVHRDTRFSKDKTPYKTNIGIQFRHEKGKDVHAPGFYVHIAPDECFLGAGIWHPDSAALSRVRAAIDEHPQLWKKATQNKSFAGAYQLAGDSLKRPPRGYAKEHPLIEDLKRKDFIGVAHVDIDDVMDPKFVTLVARSFRKSKALMQFLCSAIGLEF